jgi:peptidoglycan/xylan/chitin deacetylase (PgdA/CDA1 family)
MQRISLGVLAAALAVLIAALVAPQGSADSSTAEVVAVHTHAQPTQPSPRVTSPSAGIRPNVAATVLRAVPTNACQAGLVAFTFDDGPSPTVTPNLVRTLLDLHAPATFFMVGQRLGGALAAGNLVARSGFVVGDHTWSHPMLTHLNNAQIKSELLRTRRLMRSDGIGINDLMRPPYGAVNQRVRQVVRSLGMVPVLWTIDSRDWAGGSPRQIINAVLGHLRRNQSNIVLQHDGVDNSPNSVRAVPTIINGARKRGFCLTTVGSNGQMAVPVPQLHVTAVSGTEDGPTPIQVRLDLDRPTTRAVSVRVSTEAGSATPGEDFTPRVIEVVFPRAIPVIADSTIEPVEDVKLVFDQANGIEVLRPVVLASIFSNE